MNVFIKIASDFIQNSNLAAVFLDATLKSFAVLALVGGGLVCWRRASSATRHLIWFLAVASLPFLPLLSTIRPSWQRPVWSVSTRIAAANEFSLALEFVPGTEPVSSRTEQQAPSSVTRVFTPEEVRRKQNTAMRFNTNWLCLAFATWLAGVLWVLSSISVGRLQVRTLSRKAHLLQDASWALLLRETCETMDLRRSISVRQSAGNIMPMTWGWWRPVVLLPVEAEQWPEGRRRVVLLHELAHVKRWDCLTQFITSLVCALYWFNPLVWVAARQMRIERERACDDLVLNGGWQASDYAHHLVEIARTFRGVPRVTAIGMARASGLEQRVEAILDGGRKRNGLGKTAPLATALILLSVEFLIGAVVTKNSNQPWSLENSTIAPELKRFVAEKKAQASAAAEAEGKPMLPEFKSFFAAAEKGDWSTITNLFEDLRKLTPQYEGKGTKEERRQGIQWSAALDVFGAFEEFAMGGESYFAAFGKNTIASVPPGSIYFGGTDAGRFVITAMCKSHVKPDPFFILSQNGLPDGGYLQYLRSMYGTSLYIPSDQEWTNASTQYLEDAHRRLQHDKRFPNERRQLKPGEDVTEVDGKPQVHGQWARIGVKELLSKVIFDKNPDREFYVEESFPLDWMYPHLTPHGLIMKINRESLAQLPEAAVQKDHDYWVRYLRPIIGDWLHDDTSVTEISAFIQRVHVDHDLNGFKGDVQFLQSDRPQNLLSKLRSSIAGVYAWRAVNTRGAAEIQRMTKEAEFAFRQAFALCPSSPEAVFRYINLLIQQNRLNEAVLVAETAGKVNPGNGQFEALLGELRRMKSQKK